MRNKFAFVLVLCALLSLAVVSAAYATATSTYATWSTAAPNLGPSDTPHASYQTTTVKCAVCHAVHKANPNGEILLPTTVASACNYCHIEDNLGLAQIYNGDALNYTTTDASGTNHWGVAGSPGARCVDCHSTHGSGIDTDTSVIKYILKTNAGGGGGGAQALAETRYGATDSKNEQITIFCTECHPYFQPSYNGTITTVLNQHAGSPQFGVYQSHVMTAAHADYTNPVTTLGNVVGNEPAAYLSSAYCRSCHDAGTTDAWMAIPPIVVNSFPHYTPDYSRFMTSKGFRTDATATLSYLPNGAVSTNLPDGACLKCHRDTSATTGVGFDY